MELAALKSKLFLVTVLLLLDQLFNVVCALHLARVREVGLFSRLRLADAGEKCAKLLLLANVEARDALLHLTCAHLAHVVRGVHQIFQFFFTCCTTGIERLMIFLFPIVVEPVLHLELNIVLIHD